MLSSLGILISLGLLMFMAYRGFSVIFFAPIFALLAAAFAGFSPLPALTELFLPQLAGYVKVYFPFFLLGAVFGKIMEQSGAADAIAQTITKKLGAKHSLLAVVLSCAVLTYGGVSLFVVAFAVYPFGASLFRSANIPKRLLPATIALGAFTFTMDALPGTPQIQNSIPMKFFNTDLYAAPIFGTIGGLMIFFLGYVYLESQRKKAQQQGEGYGTVAAGETQQTNRETPSFGIAILPLVSVLVLTLVLQKIVFPNWDISPWAVEPPYKMDPNTLKGTMNNWALIIALSCGVFLATILNPKRLSGKLAHAISLGASGSLLAIMNTASEVGFGNVIKILPGFKTIAEAMMSIGRGGSPLLSEAITVNVLSGVTGSASGGLSIALDSFGHEYLRWANEYGTSPELLHRVASMASGGMDTLPHNGAVITLLAITGMTHKQSYKDIFVITLMKTAVVFILIGFTMLF
ncbi:MAG: GntP family permease [Bdellovibrionaceae bacterium]|nr:GntP family permease [Pseudobdellovibrionaceae bacterium]